MQDFLTALDDLIGSLEDVTAIEVLGALELVKQRLAFDMLADEEEEDDGIKTVEDLDSEFSKVFAEKVAANKKIISDMTGENKQVISELVNQNKIAEKQLLERGGSYFDNLKDLVLAFSTASIRKDSLSFMVSNGRMS